jgi:hypothetical protein
VNPRDGDPVAPPFDQDYVEPPEAPPPAWLADRGIFASLEGGVDGPAAGVVHDVIADMPRVTTPPAAPEATPQAASAPGPAPSAAPPATAKPAAPAPRQPRPPRVPKPPSVRQQARAAARARFARRTIRHVDPWSVLKLAIVFYTCLFLVLLVAGVVLWVIAAAAGVVGNVEHFMGSLVGDKHFHFLATKILEGTVLAGFVLVALGAAFTVLAAVFFNLIADLVGGIDVTVVEHDPSVTPPV